MSKSLSAFLLALLLLLSITISVPAQDNNREININVSADVVSTIEIVTIQSMNLSEAESVNEQIQINPQTSSNAGKMIAMGTPNSEIRISFLQQRELTSEQGAESLFFNYEVAGNTEDDQSTAEILDQENRDFELNNNGRFYLWIGGSVDISTAPPGNYQGEFTLDIEYI